jgi:hypothetical protein
VLDQIVAFLIAFLLVRSSGAWIKSRNYKTQLERDLAYLAWILGVFIVGGIILFAIGG